MTSPRSSILRRLLIFTGLAVYSFAFAEVFVRLVEPQLIMPRYVSGTAWGVRGNIPNARYWHHTPETSVEFRINSQGMRADREYPLEPVDGVCRIAIFGDSFFMGYELDLRDAFPTQLELALGRRGIRAETLNFSVSGFGTAEMLRAYEGYARKFEPDLVLFQWQSSDFDDNVRAGLYRLEQGRLVVAATSYLPAVELQDYLMGFWIYRALADHSHLYAFFRERLGRFAKEFLADLRRGRHAAPADAAIAPVAAVAAPGANVATSGPEALAAAILRRSRDEVVTDGRKFVVVEVPDQLAATTFGSSWARLSPQSVDGIPVVRPLASFDALAATGVRLYFDRGSFHLTPQSTHLLADLTAQQLTQFGLPERCQ
jgi:hypothetical protein